jgi:DNA-binding NarL/FixJ family response regulator
LYEPLLDSARSQTDRATWEVAFAEGKVMTLEQAVEYALSEEGGTTLSPSGSERSTPNEPPAALSRREREVAALVAQGLTNRQIAAELDNR